MSKQEKPMLPLAEVLLLFCFLNVSARVDRLHFGFVAEQEQQEQQSSVNTPKGLVQF